MFSVVIPLYNKAHTITNTLETVLKQTYNSFEIILVNDGSTDKSIEVVENYTSDKRIKIINQENKGVSSARNTGVENATYRHVAFLDGDDEWFPTYLEKMKDAIEKYPKAEMFCSAGMGKNAKGEYSPRQIDKFSNKVLKFDFFENPHVFLHVGAVVMTKDLFEKAGKFTVGMKRNEDFELLYKAALISQPIYSGFPLSVYVGGVEGQATAAVMYENEKLLNDTIDRYNNVYQSYVDTGGKNKTFIIFMKYELRHFFLTNTIKNEFSTNIYFLDNLNKRILKHFNFADVFLVRNSQNYSRILRFYIKMTKVIWRLRGFQVVK